MDRKFFRDSAGFMLAMLTMLALSFAVNAYAHGSNLETQFDATCRITAPGGSMGSGCVIPSTGQYAAVLTNHHVASGSVVACEFWSAGHQSAKLPGQVLCSDENLDAAIVLVPVQAFAGHVPTPLPLAQHAPAIGSVIRSVGCSQGTWATAFQGHVTRYDGIDMHFVPSPANGRSGSAITNDRGEIVGLLKNRATDNSEGGATRIEPLYAKLQFLVRTTMTAWTPAPELVQCGPNGCPGGPSGSCPSPQAEPDMFGRPPYLFPGLHKQSSPAAPASPTWPTLPQASPQADLSPIIGKLDEIAGKIPQAGQYPAAPSAPVQVGPDPQTLATLNQHGQAIDQLGKGQAELTGNVAKLGTAVGQVSDAIEKGGTLKERFTLAKEQAKEADPDASRLKLDVEAAKSMIGTHHTILGTLAIVAALAGIVGLVHWLRTGHGLVAQALEKAAARHPENTRLAELSEKLSAREEAARDKLPFLPHLAATAAGLANPATAPLAAGVTAFDVMKIVKDHVDARLAPAPGQSPTTASPVGVASQPAPAVGA